MIPCSLFFVQLIAVSIILQDPSILLLIVGFPFSYGWIILPCVYINVYINIWCIFFVHSSVNERLGGFVSWVLWLLPHWTWECRLFLQFPVFTSFGNIPRSEISRLHGSSVVNFGGNFNIVFCSGCPGLYFTVSTLWRETIIRHCSVFLHSVLDRCIRTNTNTFVFSQFSRSVVTNSLWLHGLQHARLPCPSPTPGAYSDSCPLSQWCHPAISSSVIPFSSHLQSFPASGSFQMSQFFASGGQSIGASVSASVLPVNSQHWSPLGWTGWISLQSEGLSRVFSSTTVQKRQLFGAQLSL